MANPVWAVPMNQEAIKTLKAHLVKDGKPVHFTNAKGDTVELISGEITPKHVNNLYKPHYWSFDLETIRLIEKNTGLKAHISE